MDCARSCSCSSPRIREAACWAHARRKFFDIYEANDSPIAKEALDRIGALYAIESDIRGKPPDERRAVRQARAGPVIANLHAWLLATARKLSKKSELAGAIRYALSRWVALCLYRDDGRAELDTRRSARCGPSPWGARTIPSPAQIPAGSAPPAFTPSLAPLSSTASIRKPTCAACSSASPITQSTGSRSCCRGTFAAH